MAYRERRKSGRKSTRIEIPSIAISNQPEKRKRQPTKSVNTPQKNKSDLRSNKSVLQTNVDSESSSSDHDSVKNVKQTKKKTKITSSRKTTDKLGGSVKYQSEDESSESSSDSSESDDYYSEKNRKKNTPAKKTTKAPQKKPSIKKVKPQKQLSLNQVEQINCTLYTEVLDTQAALESVVDNWTERYCSDTEQSIIDFANLILRFSGCISSVEKGDFYDYDTMEEALERLKEDIGNNPTSLEPLLMTKVKGAKQKATQVFDFVKKLILNGCNVLVYGDRDSEIDEDITWNYNLNHEVDQEYRSLFFTTIGKWLEFLSVSDYRPFRQAGTVILYNIQTSIAVLRKITRDSIQNVSRQIESESRRQAAAKARKNQRTARQIQLDEHIFELRKQDDTLVSESRIIFDNVVQFRYRDVFSYIRSETASYLAEWISKDTTTFLETNYLRYFGWLWHDPDPKVRLSAIDGVRLVVDLGNNVALQLRAFFDRFGPRLIQLAVADTDTSVLISALKLVEKVANHGMLVTDSEKISSALEKISPSINHPPNPNVSDTTTHRKEKVKKSKKSKKVPPSSQMSFSEQLMYGSDDDNASNDSDGSSTSTTSNLKNTKLSAEIGLMDLYDQLKELDDDQTYSEGKDLPNVSMTNNLDLISKGIASYSSSNVLRYISPLVMHSQQSVRAAAGILVHWWINNAWVPAILSSDEISLGMDVIDDSESEKSDLEITKKHAYYKSVALFIRSLESADTPQEDAKTSEIVENKNEKSNDFIKTHDEKTRLEKLWTDGKAFLQSTSFSNINKFSFNTESEFGFGQGIKSTKIHSDKKSPNSILIAVALSLYGKSPELLNFESILDYLSQDHSVNSESTAVSVEGKSIPSILRLTQPEEHTLLKACLVWIGMQKAAITGKFKSTSSQNIKVSTLKQLKLFYQQFLNKFDTLLVKYKDSADFLETLLAITVFGLSEQVFFDFGKISTLKAIATNIEQIISRHQGNIAICQLSVYLLSRIDNSKVLEIMESQLKVEPTRVSSHDTSSIDKTRDAPGMDLDTEVINDSVSDNIIDPPMTSHVGPLIKKLFVSQALAIINSFNDGTTEFETKSFEKLMVVRAIIRDKNLPSLLRNQNNENDISNISGNKHGTIDSKLFSEKLLEFAKGITTFSQDREVSLYNTLISISALDILMRMLVWGIYNVNNTFTAYEAVQRDGADLEKYIVENDYQSVLDQCIELAHNRDEFLKVCFEHINSSQTSSVLKLFSLVISANVFMLFSSDFVQTLKKLSGSSETKIQELIGNINKILSFKVNRQLAGEWVSSTTNFFADWANKLLPLALSGYQVGKTGNKSILASKRDFYNNYNELKENLTHNEFIVELGRVFSEMVINGVIRLSYLPDLVCFVGRVGGEIVLRDYERKINSKLDQELLIDSEKVEDGEDSGNLSVKTPNKKSKQKKGTSNVGGNGPSSSKNGEQNLDGMKDGGESGDVYEDESGATENNSAIIGFVSLSKFDLIVQNMLVKLRSVVISDTLRGVTLQEIFKGMKQNFEQIVTGDLVLERPGSIVYYRRQSAVLPRMISAMLKSTSLSSLENTKPMTSRGNQNMLGLPAVCGVWAALQMDSIGYGLDSIEMCCLESLNDLEKKVKRNKSGGRRTKEEIKIQAAYDRLSLWYWGLGQTVNGLIRPRHAQVIMEKIRKAVENRESGSIDELGQDGGLGNDVGNIRLHKESIENSMRYYMKVLGEQVDKLKLVEAQMSARSDRRGVHIDVGEISLEGGMVREPDTPTRVNTGGDSEFLMMQG
ncbi:hypothetical protein BB558_000943 [Smittium angustum]|uniref:SCD domain-containing protein n=1 Tax=Smittium angustum TaxID=133377 RepID=A0A2U1JD11_SMIAN|nr:hypothetical protein BB558_000943 [Smittium angustum]